MTWMMRSEGWTKHSASVARLWFLHIDRLVSEAELWRDLLNGGRIVKHAPHPTEEGARVPSAATRLEGIVDLEADYEVDVVEGMAKPSSDPSNP